jgi:hypothetical protein
VSGLPVKQACDLAATAGQTPWLIEGLWADQAVGILGGQPKCCKSFLALDIAVSVASGRPCLRQFPVCRKGPVLMFPAEDSLPVVRKRLDGICNAAGISLNGLPIYVITSPRILLDIEQDQQRLRDTIAGVRPAILILDPFIRLHRADENASKDVAPLLGYLRELQREFSMAVLLVHHVRKGSSTERPGQTLRGSSDLHGWGDSNLYLRRNEKHLILTVEQRAAPSGDDIQLDLSATGTALALRVLPATQVQEHVPQSASERVLEVMAKIQQPVSVQNLRSLCRIRTATLCQTLESLCSSGNVIHRSDGYSLSNPDSERTVSFPSNPIHPSGNGNGKHPEQLNLPILHQLP